MRKVLITGGAGFVGRRFCRRFLEQGDRVICVDNVAEHTGGIAPEDGWPLFDPREHKAFEFHREDCRDYFERVKDDDFDYVLHLAAMVGGRMMIEHNPLAVAEDLAIDAMYWRWAKETKPKKTLYFSSSAAYPIKFQTKDDHVLLSEDMIDFGTDIGMPDMTYGWAKLTGEYLGRLAYEKHGLCSVAYRPFSGYGEDQDDNYPFPAICKRVLANRGEDRMVVWGSGDQSRDFIHLEDCVDGVLQTMDQIDNGDAVNLSTGVQTNFKQLLGTVAGLLGFEPEVVGMSDKPEGVFARVGDTEKQRDLGFTAKTGLEDGIRLALEYFEPGSTG